MEILEGEALAELLLEKYTKNPRGWSFIVAPSRNHGFFDAIVSNKAQAWEFKMDSLFKPTPLILGAQTEVRQDKLDSLSPVAYGFRELDPGLMLRALRKSYQSSEYESFQSILESALRPVLRTEPIVPRLGRSYAQGPFVLARENIVKLCEGQESVDDRLSSELLRLFRSRYPSYL